MVAVRTRNKPTIIIMTTENYYYTVDGSAAQGPELLTSLHARREAGTLSGAVMVAREGDQEWLPIEATMRGMKPNKTIPSNPQHANMPSESMYITKIQGYALIILVGIGLIFSIYSFVEEKKAVVASASLQNEIAKTLSGATKVLEDVRKSVSPITEWEYCTLTFLSKDESRTGLGSMKPTSIEYNNTEVSKLGAAGWELVTSYLEMETAYPNFGKDEYVTGLQTNVRPQKLVLIFKRPARSTIEH
jgi:hypothetical protein